MGVDHGLNWSRWNRLADIKIDDVPDRPGVYQVRCVDADGGPARIFRAGGVDGEGILFVGRGRSLRKRIGELKRALISGGRGHSEAAIYVRYGFARQFPPDRLEIRWAELQSKDEARRAEAMLLNKYMHAYLDTPPLNLQVTRGFHDELLADALEMAEELLRDMPVQPRGSISALVRENRDSH